MSRKAVFLDRDGTIIPETGARSADTKVAPLREAIKAIKDLRAAGFLIVVVTNQAGIARGFYTEDQLRAAHDALLARFKAKGAPIDAIYYCPHLPEGEVPEYTIECDCRKPKPGMLLRAAKELDIDLASSYVIGDAERDIRAALAAGCKGAALIVPVEQDAFTFDNIDAAPPWKKIEEQMDEAAETGADAVVPDVAAAADWILEAEESNEIHHDGE
jgi:D-glycero-D-manno-heptose 1,7-bisphosphate phosphatase